MTGGESNRVHSILGGNSRLFVSAAEAKKRPAEESSLIARPVRGSDSSTSHSQLRFFFMTSLSSLKVQAAGTLINLARFGSETLRRNLTIGL
jgi:hypothetical protein